MDYQVLIPDENYYLLNFKKENLPAIAVVNVALKNFEPKEVFDWHLSIILDLEDLVENGMPSKKELELIDRYSDILDGNIKGKDKDKPNALFLARITWNETRQLIWRICDPEIANDYLQTIISDNSSPRAFDFNMEQDVRWKFTTWYLKD